MLVSLRKYLRPIAAWRERVPLFLVSVIRAAANTRSASRAGRRSRRVIGGTNGGDTRSGDTGHPHPGRVYFINATRNATSITRPSARSRSFRAQHADAGITVSDPPAGAGRYPAHPGPERLLRRGAAADLYAAGRSRIPSIPKKTPMVMCSPCAKASFAIGCKMIPGQFPEALMRSPSFVEFNKLSSENKQEFNGLLNIVDILKRNFSQPEDGALGGLADARKLLFHRPCAAAAGGAQVLRCVRNAANLRLFLKFLRPGRGQFPRPPDACRLRRTTFDHWRSPQRYLPADGQSAVEVVHQRLLQEARRLLRFSAVQVSEIGYQLGFSDPAYFSRFFTKRTGLSPSQYRLFGPS